jgi:hypothetical protein
VKKRSLQGVNEHFEPIFIDVLCQLRDFKIASESSQVSGDYYGEKP